MLALRVAYYAAIALADEARTLPSLDAYDRLTARNGVQAARLELDEDNFLKAAIAVDADDEGRWADRSALPAVVEFEAPGAPKAPSPLARRAALYAWALTTRTGTAHSVDRLARTSPVDAARVRRVITDVCGVSL